MPRPRSHATAHETLPEKDAAGGYDLSYLGGQRERYRYFGSEACRNAPYFSISNAMCPALFFRDPGVRFRPILEDDSKIPRTAKTLHDTQPIHVSTSWKTFADIVFHGMPDRGPSLTKAKP